MGMIAADAATRLARCAAVFEPGEPARTGSVAFHGDLPDGVGASGELEIAEPHGETVTVPVVRLSVADAVPVLTRARRGSDAHPAAAFWGAAVLVGLQLVARGRIMPGVTENGFDAWRAGPLDPADAERLRELAAAMPAAARAIPVPGRTPLELPDAHTLVRGFVDAVADGMPRTAAAPLVAGGPLFAARTPTKAPKLRAWSDELSAGLDAGVRVSLRLEVPGDDYTSGAFHAVVQVHSLADPAVVVDVAKLWSDGGLGPSARIEVTLALRRAARVWPPLEPLLSRGVPDRLTLDDADVTDLFLQAPRLAAAGIDVHWPKELLTSISAKAVIGQTDQPPSNLRSLLGGDGVLSFDWQLALGDQPLTKTELDQLAETHRPVVRLRDQWVLVDPEIARKARDRELKPVSAVEALGVALAGTAEIDGERVEVVSSKWLDDLRARIADPDSGADAVAQPAALTATLRDYQLRGLRWLARMTSLGLGGCLADDMGLGKTITLIALHLHRQSEKDTQGPTLVVCPASLLGNWEREITRFAPGTPVRRYHGNARTLADDGFVLTTYGTMRMDAEQLGAHRWGLLVADEAQHVKNPSSSTAKALRTIPANARVALTGTPVENNLSELWAVLDWTTPGLLGTLGAFRARWAKPIEADRDEELARRLSRLVRPFLLRRRKSDPGIAPELPPKTETDQPVSLSHEQAALYTAVVRETMESIRQADGMARRGLVMKLITGLKQVCNHPAQYLKEPSAKLTGRSGKLELLDELFDTILAEDGSVLVFTQYVTMARLIERHLRERGIGAALLHGGTPIPRREQLVAEFTEGRFPVFLLSLKAAGTGLNLTRADHVVHYDRWWNPAVEDQATDRAYRIGQTRPVQVHRLIAEGTLEDRIAEMLGTKRDLADSILASGESALTELSDVDLAALVELRGGQ
ncbi:Superfamily II DNA or RNA helicase, SNF2 family [Actinokineospora alba]|uniref:Superfamily II DNA or RNA helicase, SNF2 family n=1 Tax=Actinokineospora alba TaxID=504798 RepID=A0A1H0UXY8_9PSEU|nr:DEAD/DEAH box helicase [Actinokineospora alba]TDP68990.1 SNF2 family DNA or RNA helicase [Actinokineospora alba]SDI76893.1 Superfamily II DNA or RNA helicase, SNF2 family [Actinokineospora alba]SDP70971.1 Superfamily II DNA or RNA helicase, SNF2 family [Actinokineospora alba]